ncbi:MAG: aminotransferase class V-fold PLP-dependent enzyme [Saprospiraceae bacterium]|nr:aminotransferase class V-fold PLP-dependent enzyme [Saprospiraceae bacterium]
MQNRRTFINRLAGVAGLASFSPFIYEAQGRDLLKRLQLANARSIIDVVKDEDFWMAIRQAYTISPVIINLNNGGVCPQPKVVQDAVEHYNRLSNEGPSHFMWRILDAGREPLRYKLADFGGCATEEVAIVRNTTEALANVIFGLRLKAGDEVIITKQDYPNMINAWKQRAHREGIVLKWLNFDFPIEDEEAIVREFEKAMTPNTKLVHITHMINWNGQLLPAKKIAKVAHKNGAEVLVDGAHSFAHIDYKISDLDCDYFGSSLHKWMCAPFGSGLLYVRKDKIKNLYPLNAANEPESEDIRKFENLGTRSFAIEQAIGTAIDFHQMIGNERKQQRLYYLKQYWTEKVLKMPGVTIGTPKSSAFSGAIALLQVNGKSPLEVSEFLFSKYKIHTVAIDWENIKGVRVTPNVYTTLKELDKLVAAVEDCATSLESNARKQ